MSPAASRSTVSTLELSAERADDDVELGAGAGRAGGAKLTYGSREHLEFAAWSNDPAADAHAWRSSTT